MKKLLSCFLILFAVSVLPGTVSRLSAQDEGSDTFMLEEIVVTSQKRTERLQETTVSANVLSESSLQDSNVTSVSDLNHLVPSVQIAPSLNGTPQMSVRGISTQQRPANIGVTQGVSMMVDGVPIPPDGVGVTELSDIERVEVLRGPQSTLGGRAASAGSINIVTKRPQDTFGATAGITVTDDNEQQYRGFVTGPISDTVSFSVSANADNREYFIKEVETGDHVSTESRNVRAKLLFEPTDKLSFLLTGSVSNIDTKGSTLVYEYLPEDAIFFPQINGGLPQDIALPGIDVYYGNEYYNGYVSDQGMKVDDAEASLNVDYELGRYTLSSTTAYLDETRDSIQNVSATGIDFWQILVPPAPDWFNDQSQKVSIESFTQEFKIASPVEDPINFVAGLYYSNVETNLRQVRLWAANPYDVDQTMTIQSMAAYGRVTWSLGEKTDLITGLRYNIDKNEYDDIQYWAGAAPPNTLTASASDTSSVVVGDLTLQRTLNDYSMLYGTYARGYRPKVYSSQITLAPGDEIGDPVDQEKIDHFELGGKFTWLGGKLVTNLSAFDTIYKNYQVQIIDITQVLAIVELKAAGEAETKGIELDLMAVPTQDLRLNFNAAYIDAKYNVFKDATPYPLQTEADGAYVDPTTGALLQDLSGKPMPNSPKFKMMLSAEQRIPQAKLPFDIFVGGQYSYQSEAQTMTDQNPEAIQEAYGILNLNIKATSLGGKYSLTLFGNNVLDKFYYGRLNDFFSGMWRSNAICGYPARDSQRYFGLRFDVKY